jgi:hypothetical protein
VFLSIAKETCANNHKVAIDLTVLAESLPRKWGFLLSALACLWGLGNTLTGLIGNLRHIAETDLLLTEYYSLATRGELLLPRWCYTRYMYQDP